MKYLVTVSFLLVALNAFGATQHSDYQDGVLRGVRTIRVGSSCGGQGDTTGTVSGSEIKATTSTSSQCSDNFKSIYTIVVKDSVLEITPEHSAKELASAVVPFGALMLKKCSLHGWLPGTSIKVRYEGSSIYVFAGKRESRYSLFGAE